MGHRVDICLRSIPDRTAQTHDFLIEQIYYECLRWVEHFCWRVDIRLRSPPPTGEPKPWIFFGTNVIMRVSWCGGRAIGPLTRIGVGGTDTPGGVNSETRHIPGISRNRAHPMHVKHSPRAAMFDANGALAPGLHPPTHPCQIVSHAAAAGSVCISFMSEASLYLRQRA